MSFMAETILPATDCILEYLVFYYFGGITSLRRQSFDLTGHDSKASSCLSGACGLNGGIERQ